MPSWKLTIEYKGTRYQGWQEQSNARTVQGELRRAAEDFFREEVDLGGSGRTDAGVHALAQVAHLRALSKRSPEQVQYSLNERLPWDIQVLKVESCSERFHARHSAVARCYLYQISTRRTAFAKEYVWWVKSPLDLTRMRESAEILRGRHDFWSFMERPLDQGSTLVVVDRIDLAAADDLILVRLQASHFLWKMVRRAVGVLVQVGLGRLERDQVERFLKLRTKDVGQWTAPASGLFLEQVLYPGDLPPASFRAAVPVVSPIFTSERT